MVMLVVVRATHETGGWDWLVESPILLIVFFYARVNLLQVGQELAHVNQQTFNFRLVGHIILVIDLLFFSYQ